VALSPMIARVVMVMRSPMVRASRPPLRRPTRIFGPARSASLMFGPTSVGHVEPEHVHARCDQPRYHGRITGSRSKGGNDFRASILQYSEGGLNSHWNHSHARECCGVALSQERYFCLTVSTNPFAQCPAQENEGYGHRFAALFTFTARMADKPLGIRVCPAWMPDLSL
jgi:hypothetical protein